MLEGMSSRLVRLLGSVATAGALLVGLTAAVPAAGSAAAVPPTSLISSAAPGCVPDTSRPKREMRGEWLASVVNIDWPSSQGLAPAQQRAELRGWYDEAVEVDMNAVVLQVRPTADAFWPSPFEPWSKYLTGTQGDSPGYDPLRFAVEQAHRRDLEFHAWFNPYRVSMDTDVGDLVATHPARVHPDWRVSYGGKLYYNPGVPEARRYVEKAVLHAVRNYSIDAVHFDDYFYPYPVAGEKFPDGRAFEQYGQDFPDTATGRAEWRRRNIDLLVSELDTRIARIKPWVKFGVSPFAIWRNASTDPSGSDTQGGAETYDDLYADTRKWVRREWIDYVAPQVYWNIGFEVADYAKLTRWWSREVKGTAVQLFIGQAVYKVGLAGQPEEWQQAGELSKHVRFNRARRAAGFPVHGDLYYSGSGVRDNLLGAIDLVTDRHFRRPALQPVSRLVPGRAPGAPKALKGERRGSTVSLSWRGRGAAYAVYRFGNRRAITPCSLRDAAHLVDTFRRAPGQPVQRWSARVRPGRAVTYVVTALSRANRESGTSIVTPR